MAFPVIGGTQESGYEIDNSLRFNYPDSPRLTFTPSSDGNKRTATASFWLKRGVSRASNDLHIMSSQADTSNIFNIRIRSSGNDDVFQIGSSVGGTSSNGFMYKTTGGASFRDPSAWYHFVVAIDVTQSSGGNGVKLYVNGVLQTVYSMSSYNQNVDVNFNKSGQAMKVGIKADDTEAWDGYMSDFYWIDGTQKQASDFGEYNNDGVWIPKNYTGSYGTNGFKLEFKQVGTAADADGIGADTSGNDNHFSQTNVTPALDRTTDTPTNNFATMMPLTASSRATFTEGNTKLTLALQGSVPYGQVEFGNFFLNTGKWYYEVKATTIGGGGQVAFGWNERYEDGGYYNGHNNLGSAGNIWYGDDGKIRDGSVGETASPDTFADGDIIGIALDLDNHKFYAHKNGTYQSNGTGTGNPSNGTNGYTFTSAYNDYWTPWISKDSDNHTHNPTAEFNFGNPPFSISSGNADGNGYGNFEYAVPSGYYALCTKNLAEYG